MHGMGQYGLAGETGDMLDLATIRRLNRQHTRAAARAGNLPRLWDGKRENFRMPFIGDRTPRGFKETGRERLFVDTSGFGAINEPALTQDQMFEAMVPGYFYGSTDHGQFQCYVREFMLTGAGAKRYPAIWKAAQAAFCAGLVPSAKAGAS